MTATAPTPRFDILGIGNAIVDVVAPVPESFISHHDMRKGSMTLIDAARAEAIYAADGPSPWETADLCKGLAA